MSAPPRPTSPGLPQAPTSAFANIATPFDASGSDGGSSLGAQTRAGSLALAGGSLARGLSTELETKRSFSRQSSVNPFTGVKPKCELWRQSTAVTEKAAALGYSSVADLCGGSYIPQARLKKMKALGEGAYAVVETAQLLPDPAAAAAAAAGQWPEGEEPPKPRIVAVKRLKANILESEDDVFSFITEARLLIRLQHPSIVDYIGLGCEDASSQEAQWRTMYLVQEFAERGTLKKLILSQMINPTRKLYSLQDAVRWGMQMAEGLAYLHSNNPMIMHRDLKAENVLLVTAEDGQLGAKLADFGLHKVVRMPGKRQWSFADIKEGDEQPGSPEHPSLRLNADASSLSNVDRSSSAEADSGRLAVKPNFSQLSGQSLSGEGEVARHILTDAKTYQMTGQTGAFVYMAPEVLLTKPYNEKVDVFSFGVILYELLHRKMIIAELMYLGSAADAEAFAYKVANGHRQPIREDLPESLRSLLNACMSGTPELRPSMHEVGKRLRKVLEDGDLEAMEHMHGPGQAGCCTVM